MNNFKYERIRIPDSLAERVQQGIMAGEVIYKKNKRKKLMIKIGTAAATVIVSIGIFASSPVLASKVPVIRDIFKLFQDDYSYQGDFDAVAEKLEETGTGRNNTDSGQNNGGADGNDADMANHRQDGKNPVGADGEYTKTIDGVTVSVSEAYCSAGAVYMSLMITSEEGFPETAEAWDQPLLCIQTTERYPFTDEEDPGYGFGYLEGDFLDAHTYAGIYRIDIRDITQGDQKKMDEFLLKDSLNMDFAINKIIGNKAEPDKPDLQGKTEEELEAMTDEEWDAFMKEAYSGDWSVFPNLHENWWYDGPFEFKFNLAIDKENAQIVAVDERNETGAGLYSVSKTLFEITVEMNCSEERLKQGVFIAVLDADGKLLSGGSSSWGSTFAIGDRDVSKVYVYLCDEQEYLDELRGYRESENFRQILEERALYGKEIDFQNKNN